KQGQDINHFDKEEIAFKDGSKLSAAVIVVATDPLGIRDFNSPLVHLESHVSSVNTWSPDLGAGSWHSMTKVLLLHVDN
ncbi:hypothetical protein AZE42_09512, partial [Rhizopogon vesiculosus]